MARGDQRRPKTRKGAAPKRSTPPVHPSAAGAAPKHPAGKKSRATVANAAIAALGPDEIVGLLVTKDGRQRLRAQACLSLSRGASYNETQGLLGILRAAQHAGAEEVKDEELQLLRDGNADLRAILAEQARLRSGVLRADEAPELPYKGPPEPH